MEFVHSFSLLTEHLQTIIVAGGYPFLFLTVILEGIPLIGTAVPGHITIIAAGFLARIGIFNIWWVLVISLIAAILGDFIGFTLGRKYGMPLIDRLRRYFFIKDSHIEKTTALISKHTGKSMIIGRFSPLTRALMPFFVGTSETSVGKFWFFNIIGAFAWVCTSVALGYAFGASYHAVSGYFGKVVVIAIVAGGLILWGYRFVNVQFHIFRRYELIVLGLNLFSLYVLARMIQDAYTGTILLANFDVAVSMFMAHHVTPLIVSIATWISYFADLGPMTSIGVVVAVGLALHKKWRSTAIMLMSLSATGFFVGFMKEFFLRVRPDNALQVLTDPSFPSGHSAISAAFFTIVAYVVATHVKHWVVRESLITICVGIPILIALSRLVLNVHWFSDVVAGLSLGVFIATGSILFIRYVGILVTSKRG